VDAHGFADYIMEAVDWEAVRLVSDTKRGSRDLLW
jgi:hypothetical protein